MKNNKKTLKAVVLSLVLVAGLLLPAGASAQDESQKDRLFGLFGLFNSEEEEVGMLDLDESLPEEDGYVQYPEIGGGLFGLGTGFGSNGGLFGKGGAADATINVGITNDNFEDDAPLGSGIAILLGAALGYMALKKKEDKQ